jgi:urease accessory protein UreE
MNLWQFLFCDGFKKRRGKVLTRQQTSLDIRLVGTPHLQEKDLLYQEDRWTEIE